MTAYRPDREGSAGGTRRDKRSPPATHGCVGSAPAQPTTPAASDSAERFWLFSVWQRLPAEQSGLGLDLYLVIARDSLLRWWCSSLVGENKRNHLAERFLCASNVRISRDATAPYGSRRSRRHATARVASLIARGKPASICRAASPRTVCDHPTVTSWTLGCAVVMTVMFLMVIRGKTHTRAPPASQARVLCRTFSLISTR